MKSVVVVLILACAALSACGGNSGTTATHTVRTAAVAPSPTPSVSAAAGYSDACRKEARSWDAAATDAYTGFVLDQGDAQDAAALTQAENNMAVDCGKNSSLYGEVSQATLLIAMLNAAGVAGNQIPRSDLKKLNSLMKAARGLAE